MADKTTSTQVQIAPANNLNLVKVPEMCPDTLSWWAEQYFNFEVTTSARSQREQHRDIAAFIKFAVRENDSERRDAWSPRLSSAFVNFLRNVLKPDGSRQWSDRTINRMVAHLKTFSKWINKIKPFPLGDPMSKIKTFSIGAGLDIERALTPVERRLMLDHADKLLKSGGESTDRHRYRKKERPIRNSFRAYRNRAIIYTLIETGMRRGAVSNIDLNNVDFKTKSISVQEKGGFTHSYKISAEGLEAIRDYIEKERPRDEEAFRSPALFLHSATVLGASGRLSAWTINQVWNMIAQEAGIEGKTPHSARHAMGKHIIGKTGNIAAVQRQLGHKNAAYSMQYARISGKELEDVLNDRG